MTSFLRSGLVRPVWLLLFVLFFPGTVTPAQAQAQAPAQAGEKPVVIAFGDSLTAGYGLPAADSIPNRLEALLRKNGHRVQVLNAGVSGDTTTGGRARLDWVLSSLGTARPALVILELGANDALRGIAPAVTRANLDAMLATLKARSIPVLFCGMLAPPNMGTDYGKTFNAIYPELAKKHDVAFYPFFLDGVAARADLNQPDGMHPNAKGAAMIATRLAPLIGPLLKTPN